MTTFFYLHGWSSGPNSNKAQFFQKCFAEQGLHLHIPDLNQNDFFHLTLTRQIQQVEALLPKTPVTLIGSSLGGLVALWVAQRQSQVQRLVLLAPALNFLVNSLPVVGEEKYATWRHQGHTAFYHHAEARETLLSYHFIEDLYRYDDNDLQRPLPTLILHGQHDTVIPIQTSRDFIATRPWIQLIELDSDHSLGSVQMRLWEEIQAFGEI